MRLRRRAYKRSTRPFLLLELLVAITLVTLCLFPLLKIHTGIHKGEQKQREALKLAHQSHLAFAELKKHLYENTIPWKVLVTGCKEQFLYTSNEGLSCYYALAPLDNYDKRNQKIRYLLLNAEITFYRGREKVGQPYHFTFLAKQYKEREKHEAT